MLFDSAGGHECAYGRVCKGGWRASLGKQKERLSKLRGVRDVVAYYEGPENNIMGQTAIE